MANKDTLLKEAIDCASEIEEILDKYGCQIVVTDGVVMAQIQRGSSVRACSIEPAED